MPMEPPRPVDNYARMLIAVVEMWGPVFATY